MTMGIHSIDPNKKIIIFRKEADAIDYAISTALKGSFIVVISDVVPDALEQVKKYKEIEDGLEVPAG